MPDSSAASPPPAIYAILKDASELIFNDAIFEPIRAINHTALALGLLQACCSFPRDSLLSASEGLGRSSVGRYTEITLILLIYWITEKFVNFIDDESWIDLHSSAPTVQQYVSLGRCPKAIVDQAVGLEFLGEKRQILKNTSIP